MVDDITEGKRVEEALRESEQRLRRITDNMLDMVVETDLQGVCKYASQSVKAVLGYAPEDLVGKSLLDFVHPEDLGTVTETVQRALSTGRLRTGGRFECRYRHVDGHYVWLENLANIVRDEKGQMIGSVIASRDLTERKRMEEDAKSLARFPSENPNPILRLDRHGTVLVANEASKTLLQEWGCGIGQVAPEFWADLVSDVSSSGQSKDIEIEVSGKSYTFLVKPLVESGCVNLYGRDITERKRAEQRLRLQSEITEKMFEGIVLIRASDGVIVYTNRRFEQMFGYGPGELIGKNIAIVNAPGEGKSPEDVTREIEANLKESGVWVGEVHNVKKDGTHFWCRVNTSTLESSEYGRIWVDVQEDITDRKKMEEELRRYSTQLEQLVAERTRELAASKDFAENLIQTANAIVVGLDNSGNIRVLNQAAERITGYASKEVEGRNWFEVIVPRDRYPEVWREFERLTAGGLPRNFENPILTKSGEERFIVWQNNEVREQGQVVGTISFGIDITERRLLEEALLKSQRMAAIGELAAMVGHDLRNPLTGMTGAAYYLKKKLGPKIEKKEREMLQLIEQEIGHADKIINDLLEYSKEIRLELTQTDAKSITEDALKSMKIPSTIRVLNSTRPTPRIELDADQMRRVLVNLIRNAVDAMPRGGTLRITSRESSDNLELIIADTGEGMTTETLNKLWSPLYTTKAKGIGLGFRPPRGSLKLMEDQ
jgi:PAS domain S-box-containing protein